MSDSDEQSVRAQLGRSPRGTAGVAWRCPCGRPGVVATHPRLPDGTPFPTTYYLTCQRATAACSTLEASGAMPRLAARLATEPELAHAYEQAHRAYLSDRDALGEQAGIGPVPEIAEVSAGGMPGRVKCLHALLGHALAAGPGVNPVGDWTRDQLGDFWSRPCLPEADAGEGDARPPSGSASGTGAGGRDDEEDA